MKESALKVLCVVLFAYFGVFIRMTLTFLSKLPTDSLLPRLGASFFLPNIVGSFLLGFLTPMAELFKPHLTPIHVGITSGFCGSCTTFATWQLVAAAQFLTGKWIDSILQSLITFSSSYISMMAGFHSGDHVRDRLMNRRPRPVNSVALQSLRGSENHDSENHVLEENPRMKEHLPEYSLKQPPKFFPATVIVILIGCAIAIWIGVFIDDSLVRAHWWVAIGFGPLGALIRYGLSLYNPRFPNFPVYTFIVNIAGTVLNMLMLMIDNHLEGYPILPSTEDATISTDVARSTGRFWVRFGISSGMMGSLSTVSTWVSEIFKLSRKKRWLAYRYAFASLLVAQISCCVIGGIWLLAGKELKL